MIEHWVQQLQSPDSQKRREAITALANSRDPAALVHLAAIYRNDPDLGLRELALKAGRYINMYKAAAETGQYATDMVFLSYSRSDWETFVKPLVEHLRAEGLTVWVDQHLLQGGQDWLDEINRAAQSCRCMVLCISPVAMDSKYVKMEYRYFIDEDKPIIPVVCSETELPIELRGLQYLRHSEQDKITQRVRYYLNR